MAVAQVQKQNNVSNEITGNNAAVTITPNQTGGTIVFQSVEVPANYTNFFQSYFIFYAYISPAAGPTNILLSAGGTFVVVDVPNGPYTDSAEIVAAINGGTGEGPPGGVGPS
jgi:hypothetical protein